MTVYMDAIYCVLVRIPMFPAACIAHPGLLEELHDSIPRAPGIQLRALGIHTVYMDSVHAYTPPYTKDRHAFRTVVVVASVR